MLIHTDARPSEYSDNQPESNRTWLQRGHCACRWAPVKMRCTRLDSDKFHINHNEDIGQALQYSTHDMNYPRCHSIELNKHLRDMPTLVMRVYHLYHLFPTTLSCCLRERI